MNSTVEPRFFGVFVEAVGFAVELAIGIHGEMSRGGRSRGNPCASLGVSHLTQLVASCYILNGQCSGDPNCRNVNQSDRWDGTIFMPGDNEICDRVPFPSANIQERFLSSIRTGSGISPIEPPYVICAELQETTACKPLSCGEGQADKAEQDRCVAAMLCSKSAWGGTGWDLHTGYDTIVKWYQAYEPSLSLDSAQGKALMSRFEHGVDCVYSSELEGIGRMCKVRTTDQWFTELNCDRAQAVISKHGVDPSVCRRVSNGNRWQSLTIAGRLVPELHEDVGVSVEHPWCITYNRKKDCTQSTYTIDCECVCRIRNADNWCADCLDRVKYEYKIRDRLGRLGECCGWPSCNKAIYLRKDSVQYRNIDPR
ncbi:hypothetical protein UVI_02047370 [Ustilaginoidea virens]|uniref:Uncharacterized protein n=1 Tax=Ustilaginoidea virens TaxID=1159556 RepID=A0A1B5L2D5_USTVR|nr:hypothetical protein UVI_02047370 [Ustilaginoidea virens]